MFIILKKTSIKRTLALAILLILIGANLSHPFKAQATESELFYLYPYPSKNPSQTSLFWSEANPKMGAYSLGMWKEIEPNRQIVIGLPEGYNVNSALIGRKGGNIGKISDAITARIKNRYKSNTPTGGKSTSSKDVLNYEREITPEGGIKEKVRVEIVEHFRDNDNFEKYMTIIKQNITNVDEVPEDKPNPPVDETAQATMVLGNTFMLGGALLFMIKLLPLLL